MADVFALEVRNITKIFPGVKALSDFSFVLRKGEIHGIVGENGAGKSTLMNIISGNIKPNKGEILIEGANVTFSDVRHAKMLGISIVHQELVNCPDVSVAENIFMNSIDDSRHPFMNFKRMCIEANKLLEAFECKIDASQKMKNLKVSEQQIVEIVKALSMQCKIVIFDEPTASLTEQETEELFKIIENLKQNGISMIYISHRLEEISRMCDRVTILKDGTFVDTLEVAATKRETIINKMVGRELKDFYPPKAREIGEVIFEASGFTQANTFENISFQLRKGEILGLSGLIGSGRSEVVRAICGIDPRECGSVRLCGKKISLRSYRDALKHGIVYLTEDRKSEGLLLNMSIMKNISVLNLDQISKGVFVNPRLEYAQAETLSAEMNVKKTGIAQKAGTLSGGNQQKVLIAKSLSIKPRIIIFDEPTRGVDVGAKVEIYNKIRELAAKGVGIILISSELPEIIGMSDRVLVMHEGRVNGELSGQDINETKAMHKASGY